MAITITVPELQRKSVYKMQIELYIPNIITETLATFFYNCILGMLNVHIIRELGMSKWSIKLWINQIRATPKIHGQTNATKVMVPLK